MDNLTHTLLGITMANSGLVRKYGSGAVVTMIAASNIPDIDVLRAWLEGGGSMLFRRMFTHSLIGLPLIAAALALLLRFYYRDISWKALFGMCLLGMGVHVFFDLVNSYGVVLLYPFSLKRFELAWIFIIDLAFWGLLLAPLLLSLAFSRWISLERLSRVFLVCVGLYVSLCAFSRARSASILEREAKDFGPEFSYVFPEALGPHRFRGVVRKGNDYRMYLIHVFKGKAELKRQEHTDLDSAWVQKARETESARKLEWFFKAPVWKIGAPVRKIIWESGIPVDVYDLRFQTLVFDRGIPFSFRFHVSGNEVRQPF